MLAHDLGAKQVSMLGRRAQANGTAVDRRMDQLFEVTDVECTWTEGEDRLARAVLFGTALVPFSHTDDDPTGGLSEDEVVALLEQAREEGDRQVTVVLIGVGPDVDATGAEVIDADGLLVTPGFVDIHTHFDGQATWDPWLAPSSWHGVTTIVMGNKEGQVPLDKLAEHIKKLPKTLESNQVTDIRQRLRALDAVRPQLPMPKGPMPNSSRAAKGSRQAMRGR